VAHELIRSSSMGLVTDSRTQGQKVAEALRTHAMEAQADKLTNPDRFSLGSASQMLSVNSASSGRGPNGGGRSADASPPGRTGNGSGHPASQTAAGRGQGQGFDLNNSMASMSAAAMYSSQEAPSSSGSGSRGNGQYGFSPLQPTQPSGSPAASTSAPPAASPGDGSAVPRPPSLRRLGSNGGMVGGGDNTDASSVASGPSTGSGRRMTRAVSTASGATAVSAVAAAALAAQLGHAAHKRLLDQLSNAISDALGQKTATRRGGSSARGSGSASGTARSRNGSMGGIDEDEELSYAEGNLDTRSTPGGKAGGNGGSNNDTEGESSQRSSSGLPTTDRNPLNGELIVGTLGFDEAKEAVSHELDPAKPAAQCFADLVASGWGVPDPVAVYIIGAVTELAHTVIPSCCLANPRDFMVLISFCVPLLTACHESQGAFTATVELLVAAGKAMSSPTSAVTLAAGLGSGVSDMAEASLLAGQLFRDFALPALSQLLLRRPTKRAALVRIAHSFQGSPIGGDRLPFIRALQEQLKDADAFIACLAALAPLESVALKEASKNGTNELPDLLLYYAQIGLSSPSPSLRAASVGIVTTLGSACWGDVLPLLHRLYELRTDTWWEMKVQLAIVTSALARSTIRRLEGTKDPLTEKERQKVDEGLIALGGGNAGTGLTRALDLCFAILRAAAGGASIEVLKVVSSCLIPVIQTQSGQQLLPLYIDSVVALSNETRSKVFGVGMGAEDAKPHPDPVRLVSAAGAHYAAAPLLVRLPSLPLLKALVGVVSRRQLQQLEPGHFQLLTMICWQASGQRPRPHPNAGGSSPREEDRFGQEHLAAFKSLQDHLFVGVCDPDCCRLALEVLRNVVLYCPGGLSFLSAATLLGSLVLVHQPPSGQRDPVAETLVANWFDSIARVSQKTTGKAVSETLHLFSQRYPRLFEASPLRRVYESLTLNLGV
jgi:hypothetical protein